MQNDYDVIVVGGGGAGLSAAIEATNAGAKTIVLEADTTLGGATAQSGGVFFAAGTSVQRAAGYTDTAEAMFDYIMALNHWKLKPDLTLHICQQSGPTLEWLIAYGAVFPPEWLVKGGLESPPRAHASQGAGTGIADALINAAGAIGVETALGSRVDKLLVEDGRVVGVSVDGFELRAAAVVITTGGFGNNPEKIARHFPRAARHGDWVWAVHDRVPFILGDGIDLGEQAGAAIVGHDTGMLLPASGYGKALEPFMPPWLMMVNREGRRFMPEASTFVITGYAIEEQTDHIAFAIFDQNSVTNASNDLRYIDPYNSGITFSTWDEATIEKRLATGSIVQFQTLNALVAHFGIDAIALHETVRLYNEDCVGGTDTHFLQQVEKRFPVSTPPFYGAEVRPAVIAGTGAGLDIDRETYVLDSHGRRIPGLFAAGEVLGVLSGKRDPGGGYQICPAIVLGRTAGLQAAKAALQLNHSTLTRTPA